jgi:hypothetical protein
MGFIYFLVQESFILGLGRYNTQTLEFKSYCVLELVNSS